MPLTREDLDSPVGDLVLLHDDRLCGLAFADGFDPRQAHPDATSARPTRRRSEAARRLRAYFDGDLDALDAIAVAEVGTPLQRRVWQALRAIPVGQTRSYAEIARAVGRPGAARAIGRINGRNPIAIVVPCHRVIGADGTLTGYGGGIERKRWLLAHEKAVLV